MLADIVERLSNWKHASFRRDGSTLETMNEAADEITTLRARVKELEEQAKPYNLPAPYKNCQFRHCDLRGQCLAEGKCHHPNQPKDNK